MAPYEFNFFIYNKLTLQFFCFHCFFILKVYRKDTCKIYFRFTLPLLTNCCFQAVQPLMPPLLKQVCLSNSFSYQFSKKQNNKKCKKLFSTRRKESLIIEHCVQRSNHFMHFVLCPVSCPYSSYAAL